MLYRKAPLQPTRLLLRVVAGAGAGALLACSSSSAGVAEDPCTHGACDSGVVEASAEGGSDAHDDVFYGSVDGSPPAEGGSDAHDDHVVVGVVPNGDGGQDASADGPVGVVVHPDSGAD